MADTDWPQILALYDLLELARAQSRSPRSTARWPWAWCTGRRPACGCSPSWPRTSGWRGTTACSPPGRTCGSWPGDTQAAAADYLEAARRATSLPERRYLAVQAARLEADLYTARRAG